MRPPGVSLLGLLLLTLLGTAASALAWASARGRPGLVVLPVLAAAALTVGVVLGTTPSDVDIERVTVLQEAGGRTNLAAILGEEVHAGPVWMALTEQWGLHSFGDVRAIVRMNLWLWALQAITAAAVVRAVLPRTPWAWLWTALVVFNPAAVHAAFSEGPGALLGLGTWLAAGPVALAASATLPWQRWLATLTLGALTVSATLVRVEFALPGVLALLAAASTIWPGPHVVDAHLAALWARFVRATVDAARRPAFPIAVAAAVVALHLLRSIGPYTIGTAAWMAVPVAPQLVLALVDLLPFLPLGAVALAALGTIHLARRPATTGLVVLSLPALLRGWRASANGEAFEYFRYLTMGSPLVLLVATFGWWEIRRWVDRSADPRAARGLALAALGTALWLPPPSGQQHFVVPDFDEQPVRDGLPMLLSTLHQEEVRLALQALDRWPECTLVSLVTTDAAGPARLERWTWLLLRPGSPVSTLPADNQGLDGVLANLGTPCARLLVGQDCNLAEAPNACDALWAAGPTLLERRVRGGQYLMTDQFGRYGGTARIAVIDPSAGAPASSDASPRSSSAIPHTASIHSP